MSEGRAAVRHYKAWHWLGPGLITGASDDDPSGIATYSQAGAQFGYALGWTMLLTFPLMAAVQEISARIGRVTGYGLAGNLRRHYPAWLLRVLVALLVIANVLNLAADLGAMGAAVQLVAGGKPHLYAALFGVVCATLQIFTSYRRYVRLLKWLTLSLLAYVAVVFVVDMPWQTVAWRALVPDLQFSAAYLGMVVALFGTTISPYLFFWQSSQEAEEMQADPHAKRLALTPKQAGGELRRIRIDTYVGMAASNIVGFFIIITAAATLNANGVTDIQTSAQAAEALRPVAGAFAATVFAMGIIGTGLLAVPVLAGSAAYALAEAFHWPTGLARAPREAKAFYAAIGVATAIGIGVNFWGIDPIKALIASAVLNGIVAVPSMAVMMTMARQKRVMGRLTIGPRLAALGWLATGIMALAVAAMGVTAVL